MTNSYPSWSPYPFAMNRPIDGVDVDGLEFLDADILINSNLYGPNISVENADGTYNLHLSGFSIENVWTEEIGDKIYFDVGQHLYSGGGIVRTTGNRSQQLTDESLVGLQVINNIENLPTAPNSYDAPDTFEGISETYEVANQYANCWGVCYATTMSRINRAFEDVTGSEVLDLTINAGSNQDFNISGTINTRTIPRGYLGYGVGGAVARNGNGNLIDNAGVWNGGLQKGALLQIWHSTDPDNFIGPGHSQIFRNYLYDESGNITGMEILDNSGVVERRNRADDERNETILGANPTDN